MKSSTSPPPTEAYRALLERLLPARRFGVVLGLDRMRAILDRLGAPDRRLGRIVHVAGTNGKGSTVAMIAALAVAAGQRVARYTSPHLSSLRERIVIDDELISEAAIVSAADRVRAQGGDELTFFEQITAIAMVAIADAAVDLTVLEVGLGGRLDATNVVDPAVTVVTGVALDHEAILGSTLAAIAAEKAGIWKAGRPAIIGASGLADAVPVLVAAAHAAGAPVTIIDDAALAAVPPVGLLGAHQRRNAAAALAALRALGLPVVPAALAHVTHPGRFEILVDRATPTPPADEAARAPVEAARAPVEAARAPVEAATTQSEAATLEETTRSDPATIEEKTKRSGRPTDVGALAAPTERRMILDGAHNPHGAAALAATLIARGERPVLIVAVSADKDVAAIAAALIPAVCAVIATRYQQDRAMEPAALASIFERVAQERAPDSRLATLPISHAANLADALDAARVHDAPIVIAGSLFLVGEARTLLLGAPTDPIRVSDPPAK